MLCRTRDVCFYLFTFQLEICLAQLKWVTFLPVMSKHTKMWQKWTNSNQTGYCFFLRWQRQLRLGFPAGTLRFLSAFQVSCGGVFLRLSLPPLGELGAPHIKRSGTALLCDVIGMNEIQLSQWVSELQRVQQWTAPWEDEEDTRRAALPQSAYCSNTWQRLFSDIWNKTRQ